MGRKTEKLLPCDMLAVGRRSQQIPEVQSTKVTHLFSPVFQFYSNVSIIIAVTNKIAMEKRK